jgi:CheY-like chemotaxis protein
VSRPALAWAARPGTSEPRNHPRGYWEPRVLVVDDDPVCLLVARRMLEKLGLAVDAAATGVQAVLMAARWRYAAVFMDCAMPDIDGYSAAQRIRAKHGPGTSPPVIAVTSRLAEVCLAAGMDHHIAKPVRLDTLRSDCTRLGLIVPGDLPRADARVSPVSPVSPVSLREPEVPEPEALELPLLQAGPGLTETRTAELAEMFVERAVPYLPGLWRASNLRDLDALGRLALELWQRATTVGAVRLAALCEALAAAAAHGHVETATGLVHHIRQAVQQTAGAARAQLDPAAAVVTRGR